MTRVPPGSLGTRTIRKGYRGMNAMRTLLRALSMFFALAALTACGGGGGSGGGGGGGANEPPKAISLNVTANKTQLPANPGNITARPGSEFSTQVTVRVTRSDGSAVANGTSVTLSVNPAATGTLSIPDDPATAVNELTQRFQQVSTPTAGGDATFFFTSGTQTGTATLRASAPDPDTNRTQTDTLDIQVQPAPDSSGRIRFQATRTRLPANVAGVAPFIGSPFISEIQVSLDSSNGTPLPNGETVNFNIFPVELGALSTLDDPETADVNEFTVLLGAGFEEVNSGQVKLFFHAFDKAGTATITVSYDDPETGETIFNTFDIEIVESGSTLLPDSVTFNQTDQPLYVQGSGGDTSIQFEAIVEDGAGEPVPDPEGRNNVRIELVNQGPSLGATLSGTNFAGNQVSGNSIRLATTNGRASASLRSGDKTGVQTVRVTADRQDNNVNNGIADPVSNLFDVTISDGQLFSLTLTNPNVNAIEINRVNPETVVQGDPEVPPDPDGTYSLTVSALGTDRGGNPVVPGTNVSFGILDAPLVGFPDAGPGSFALSGGDGDPDEGRNRFESPTGAFMTAGGGAGPGDTLALFAEQVQGNSDLEGSRKVDQVVTNTVLRVSQAFNLNDTTGSSVNNGPVIPYAIGRATHGSITDSALTDENGVATVQLNYPVSQLGRSVIIWAQGSGGLDTQGDPKTVGEVALAAYPGVAPGTLIASPSTLPANSTNDVTICVFDAVSSPIQGAPISFSVTNPQGAVVEVDGQTGSGTVSPATGANGCTVATVESTGVGEPADEIVIVFSFGGLSDTVEIVPPGNTVLLAIPSGFFGNGNKEITLRYLDGGGSPIPGVQIVVDSCESDGGSLTVLQPPGITNAAGETTAVVQANVDSIEGGASGTCTFAPAGGPPPEAVVTFQGADLCNFSPQPAGCE